jgi:OOP family OmpA-OmpF porin
MKYPKSPLYNLIAVLLALPAVTLAATPTPNPGYWLDSSGRVITSSVSNLCWHTGEWTPALAMEPCDPVAKTSSAATQAVPMATPVALAPVALAPAALAPGAKTPATVVAPVPVALSKKMSISTDALFAFDKSTLNADGKKMLDDVARQLKSSAMDHVHVIGNADRLGSDEYNMALSVRRADAVRDYLVAQGVATHLIDSKGVGESAPVTASGECVGPQSAKVIACLQPDRRVDVDLQGTQTAAP